MTTSDDTIISTLPAAALALARKAERRKVEAEIAAWLRLNSPYCAQETNWHYRTAAWAIEHGEYRQASQDRKSRDVVRVIG